MPPQYGWWPKDLIKNRADNRNIYISLYTRPAQRPHIVCGASVAAHAVLLCLSVSTHFTLHFPSHQGAEGDDQRTGQHVKKVEENIVSGFQIVLLLPIVILNKDKELEVYLGSSLVPRRKPAPLYHNLEIWDLNWQHKGEKCINESQNQ